MGPALGYRGDSGSTVEKRDTGWENGPSVLTSRWTLRTATGMYDGSAIFMPVPFVISKKEEGVTIMIHFFLDTTAAAEEFEATVL